MSVYLMNQTPLIVLDIETTGLSPYKHRITEIAAAKVLNGEVIDTFQALVNPEVPIPRFITRLTGITDEMVYDKPRISQVLPSLRKFLANHPIFAHNANFDIKFLRHNFRYHVVISLQNKELFTSKLARRVLKELPSKKLGSLCQYYGITNNATHRAFGDVEVTVKILKRMSETLQKSGICDFEQVDRFQSLPIPKASQLISNTRNV